MRKFFLLFGASLKMLFNRNREKKKSGVGTAILLVFVFAYMAFISGGLFMLMGSSLSGQNLLLLIPALAFAANSALTMITAAFSSQGYLFKSKDLEMLFSLPVSHRMVMTVKLALLYFYELLYSAVILIPAFFAYFYYAGATFAGIFGAFLSVIVSPLLPMFIGLLFAFLIGFITKGSRRKNLLTIIVSVAVLAAYFVAVQNGEGIAGYLMDHGGDILAGIGKYYFPALLLCRSLEGSIVYLLLFLLVNIVPLAVSLLLLSRFYAKLVTVFSSSGVKKKSSSSSHRTEKQKSRFGACLKKELAAYFSSSVYVMNTAVGPILMTVFVVYSAFSENSMFSGLAATPETRGLLAPIVCALMMFMSTMVSTTAASVSLEGSRLWIYKSAPVEVKTIFAAKTAVNLIINIPFILLDTALACVFLGLSASETVSILLILIPAVTLISLLGLVFNLLKPRLDFVSEAVVIKQSISVLFTMLSGMGLTILSAFLYFVFSGFIGFSVFAIIFFAVISGLCCLTASLLGSRGVIKFNAL